ncbi:hypothetical protein BpHYR1_031471 [Brachionus plicatilis]|uniref:Uncharacterized protein n=1 Tax=Brachionus plicatilis TaxID=10195 RepID=A0A3M7RM90_BRAPC|nr:hypothetical protein BpHYR1_031471 [Brachionus plicatilis]
MRTATPLGEPAPSLPTPALRHNYIQIFIMKETLCKLSRSRQPLAANWSDLSELGAPITQLAQTPIFAELA